MTKTKVIAAVLTALSLSACATPHASNGDETVVGGRKGSVLRIRVMQYNGHPLYCITYNKGLSCDWVRYHLDNPATGQ